MPLFYQHNINDSTKLAVWHITENEDFFLEKVTIKKEVTHPHKRLQHLAGRYLLQILHPDFPLHLIEIAESKKPLLSNGEFHFSISHCGDFAAAILSENKPVGIDAQRDQEYLNNLNQAILNKLQSGGEVFPSNAVLNGNFLLRVCIVNFRTCLSDVEALPAIVLKEGKLLHEQMQKEPKGS